MDVSRGSSNQGGHRSTRLRRLVCAGACAAAAVSAMAPPAGAYLINFEQVRLGTPTASNTYGGRPVQCPSGKFMIGVGGGLRTGAGYEGLALTGLGLRIPTQGIGAVAGVETDPVAGPWHMAAHGFCAAPTLTQPSAAPSAAYIRDVEVVANPGSMNSDNFKRVSAGCLGRESIGGGYSIAGAGGASVTARTSFLIDGDNVDGYEASAHESDATSASWQLSVWAICAERGPGSGARYPGNSISMLAATSGAVAFIRSATATARCPAGQRIIGGSAEVLGTTDTATPPAGVTLARSSPSGTGANATAWIGRGVEEDATFAPWRIRARAVCALMVPRN